MQNNIVSFPDAVRTLMEQRELNITLLTQLLSYKSKTTVSRILQKKAGSRAILSFYRDLKNSPVLALNEEELSFLSKSLEYSVKGEDYCTTHEEMWKLLCGTAEAAEPVTVLSFSGVPESGVMSHDVPASGVSEVSDELDTAVDLSAFFAGLAGVRCDILMFNCVFPGVTDVLASSFPTFAPESTVTHYIDTDTRTHRTLGCIRRLMPMLALPQYEVFTVESDNGTNVSRTSHFSVITVRVLQQQDSLPQNDGEITEYELLFLSSAEAVMTEGHGLYARWERIAGHLQPRAYPLRRKTGSHDLIPMTETYLNLENGRNIWKLKPDLCLCYIREYILRAALEDGCRSRGVTRPPALVEHLYTIQKKRFDNIFGGTNATHLIVSPEAMRQFTVTGRQSDHYHLMRPYSVMERIEILSFCINQLKCNPYFHIYLIRPESEHILLSENPVELICFDDTCVQLTPAITDYNLESGHSEIFIDDASFTAFTRSFFEEELLKKYVFPQEKTVAFFAQLITQLSGSILS